MTDDLRFDELLREDAATLPPPGTGAEDAVRAANSSTVKSFNSPIYPVLLTMTGYKKESRPTVFCDFLIIRYFSLFGNLF